MLAVKKVKIKMKQNRVVLSSIANEYVIPGPSRLLVGVLFAIKAGKSWVLRPDLGYMVQPAHGAMGVWCNVNIFKTHKRFHI